MVSEKTLIQIYVGFSIQYVGDTNRPLKKNSKIGLSRREEETPVSDVALVGEGGNCYFQNGN